MIVRITPTKLSGELKAVSSKSQIHRILFCAMQAEGTTEIAFRGLSKDIEATCNCIKSMGAEVFVSEDLITVKRGDYIKSPYINCYESGSTARFAIPVAAAVCQGGKISGEGRLPERPFSQLVREIRRGGCEVSSEKLPIKISGGLKSGDYYLEGNISSQYFTGLMLALPSLSGDSRVMITSPLESASYIDITIDVLKLFGVNIKKGKDCFEIPGNQRFVAPGKLRAEGDWSNAAFFLAANRMGSKISLTGLDISSSQGDRIFEQLSFNEEIDVSDVPDLVPALAVLSAAVREKTVIKGGSRLRLKESDRIASTVAMINSLGGCAVETDDGMVIYKGLKGGKVDSFGDHRIVMSAAIAATVCTKPVEIYGAENAAKSYPEFFDDYKKLGGVFDVQG